MRIANPFSNPSARKYALGGAAVAGTLLGGYAMGKSLSEQTDPEAGQLGWVEQTPSKLDPQVQPQISPELLAQEAAALEKKAAEGQVAGMQADYLNGVTQGMMQRQKLEEARRIMQEQGLV